MVFKVQSLYTFVNGHLEVTVPVVQSPLDSSSSSSSSCPYKQCCNFTGEIAAWTTQLFTAPVKDLNQRRRKKARDHTDRSLISDVCLGHIKKYSLDEIQDATCNFSSKNKLGEGGFGSVYKGKLTDGSIVAVKRLKNFHEEGKLQFKAELEVGSMAIHKNLSRLLGYCITPTERILVYVFMPKGSLADHLGAGMPLDWPVRKKIALGVARALAHLHEYCHIQIIHHDVKPWNILLDENFEPVVSDFGLARFMSAHSIEERSLTTEQEIMPYHSFHKEPDYSTTNRICGTYGYMAPEYVMNGQYSEKTDIYAYGITVMQLAMGASDTAHISNLSEKARAFLKDNKVETQVGANSLGHGHYEEDVEKLIKVGLLCARSSPSMRPKISEVIRMLENVVTVEGWEDENKYEESSPWQQAEAIDCEVSISINYPSSCELSGPR